MNLYIIGDVHGCYKTLMALVDKLPKDARLCFVGDLIDRGPNSKDVIEFVKNNNHLCVKGNHEDMMYDYTPPGPYGETSQWLSNGGITTLQNYEDDYDLLQKHLAWIGELPIYIEFPILKINKDKERYLVVSHSSIARVWKNRDIISEHKLEDHILWNRDIARGTLPSSNEIYNIFGHTVDKKPIVKKFFACIDTGCVYNQKGYGNLTAIHFPSLEVIQQENIED